MNQESRKAGNGMHELPDGSGFFVMNVGPRESHDLISRIKYHKKGYARRWLFAWRNFCTGREGGLSLLRAMQWAASVSFIVLLVLQTAAGGNDFITNDSSKPVPVTVSSLPTGATAKTGASGNVANASAAGTLAAVSGKTNYITGFQVTAAGATGALVVNVTVTGIVTGTMTYTFSFPAGVTVGAAPLIVSFDRPVPASATNTAITVTLPASGAGGTNAAVNVQGFDL